MSKTLASKMKAACTLAVALFCCWDLVSANTAVGVTQADRDAIVAKHNEFRAGVDPTATNMKEMVWDSLLEKKAQDYANNCEYGHNPDSSYSGQGFSSTGENIAAGSGFRERSAYVKAVVDWHSEVKDLNYGYNKTGVIGHYTQVVWADTYKVGCGMIHCDENTPFGPKYPTWTFVVCNYGPPGNYQSKALTPYKSGPTASECATKTADGKLCALTDEEKADAGAGSNDDATNDATTTATNDDTTDITTAATDDDTTDATNDVTTTATNDDTTDNTNDITTTATNDDANEVNNNANAGDCTALCGTVDFDCTGKNGYYKDPSCGCCSNYNFCYGTKTGYKGSCAGYVDSPIVYLPEEGPDVKQAMCYPRQWVSECEK